MQAVPMMSQPAVASASKTQDMSPAAKRGENKFSPLLEQATAKTSQATEEAELAGAANVTQVAEASVEETVSSDAAGVVDGDDAQLVAEVAVGAEQDIFQGIAEMGDAIVDAQGAETMGQAAGVDALTGSVAAETGAAALSLSGQEPSAETVKAGLAVMRGAEQGQNAAQVQVSAVSKEGELSAAQTTEAVVSQVKQEVAAPTQVKGEVAQMVATELKSQFKAGSGAPIEIVEGFEPAETAATKGQTEISDPRFAALLNKPEIEGALRQRQAAAGETAAVATTGATPQVMTEAGVATAGANAGEAMSEVVALGEAKGQSAEALLNRPAVEVSQAPQHAAAVAHAEAAAPAAVRFDETMVTLRNGDLVPEGRIVNQTLEHLSIHARGDSSAVTVKLHPEELGELHLRMVMEGDQLKVHLQAQNQQVQEVLERNFPRLRDALQEQGLTVEDFQVSVDSGSREQQHSAADQERSARPGGNILSSLDDELVEHVAQVAPMAAAAGGGGLSVRI